MTTAEPATDQEAEGAATDGRTARRERNRDLVLDAVLELFAEDSLEPSAPEVAARSGVSLRSVYRYFDDTDVLIRAAITRHREKVRPLFEIEGLGEGPVAVRIDRLNTGRFRLYEKIAPMIRATLRRAPTNDILRDSLEMDFRAMRNQVEQTFAEELGALTPVEAREVVGALDILLGFHSIEHLRRTRGLSGPESRRIIGRAVAAVLDAPD